MCVSAYECERELYSVCVCVCVYVALSLGHFFNVTLGTEAIRVLIIIIMCVCT